jgi:NADH:ubiquinone oxidoreductase subunit B-like Fe-S oxidoreductase
MSSPPAFARRVAALVPDDLYIRGCPPTPISLLEGLIAPIS